MTAMLAIDFEASCLPRHGRSFPIEVGIADRNGWSRAWLIAPHADWNDWHWSEGAENLHGITPALLSGQGLPAHRVVSELMAVVGDRRLIADSHLDQGWFATLCAAAKMPQRCKIGHIDQLTSELGSTHEDIADAVKLANAQIPGRHRAATDALWLANVAATLEAFAVEPRRRGAPLFPWARLSGIEAGTQAMRA